MIKVSFISKSYITRDGTRLNVLNDVNLRIGQGEFVTIVGPSGCGKTTLLKILCGLLKPDSGRISINDGVNCRVGYLSQADSLLPWRSVIRNVELGLEIQGKRRRDRNTIVRGSISRMGLNGFERCYPHELSGGMKKRVTIMRTLAYDPDIIYMDEPFSALDVHTRNMIEDDLLSLWQESKKTIVFITNDLTEAISLADRVIVMTARPATIKSEYAIHLPRPRSTDIRFTTEFIKIQKEIWTDLRVEVQKSREIDYAGN